MPSVPIPPPPDLVVCDLAGTTVYDRGEVRAEGDLDFRGTLGVSKEVPVGFRAIRLHFALDTDATPEQLATLEKLTERYCVVLQTLRTPPALSVRTTA